MRFPVGRARVASTRISPLRVQTLTSASDATLPRPPSQANLSFHGVEYIVTISSARTMCSPSRCVLARVARTTADARPSTLSPRAPDDDGLSSPRR